MRGLLGRGQLGVGGLGGIQLAQSPLAVLLRLLQLIEQEKRGVKAVRTREKMMNNQASFYIATLNTRKAT